MIIHTEPTRDGSGSVAVGMTGREVRKVPMGKAVSMVTVTELEAPARFVLRPAPTSPWRQSAIASSRPGRARS